jgi:nucleolar GTP-binding protein
MLELAFHRAAKVSVSGSSATERHRRLALRKIGRTSGNLLRQLRLAGHAFEDPETLGPFRRALLEERLGKNAIALSLRRLRRAQERLIRLRTEEERLVPRLEEREQIAQAVRRYYGRAASLLREVAGDLARLEEAQRLLRDRPALDPSSPVVAVVGYPNVGKSSLVARLTRSHPKVAPYPFTTLSVAVGHASIGPLRQAQLVDTPGMLERAEADQNAIEREAFLALGTGGNVVVFLLDPSGSCGWPLAEQEALLSRLKARFPEKTFFEVENKADLGRTGTGRRKISCATGDGVDALMVDLATALQEEGGGLPPLPPLREEEIPIEEAPMPPRPRRRR